MKGLKGTFFINGDKIEGSVVGEYLEGQFEEDSRGMAGITFTMLIIHSQGEFLHVPASDFTPTSL